MAVEGVEAGTAYLTIIASARGIGRDIQKEVAREVKGLDKDILKELKPVGSKIGSTIGDEVSKGVRDGVADSAKDLPEVDVPVHPKFDDDEKIPPLKVPLDPLTQQLRADLTRDLTALSREINAKIPIDADTNELRRELSADIAAIEESLKAEIPTEPGDKLGYERELRRLVSDVQDRVKAHINVDRDNFPALQEIGTDAGRTVSGGFTSALNSGMAAVPAGIANPVLIGVAIAIGALLLIPATVLTVATALTGLGLGFLGLGVYAIRGNQEVQSAFSDMKSRIGKVFSDVAQPLVKPVVEAMGIIATAIEDAKPQLEQLFIELAPLIKPMAQAFADFTKNVMPGLVDAIIASKPFIQELIREMPELGKILRDFLSMLAKSGPDAILLFRFAIQLLGIALKLLGGFIYGTSILFGLFVDAVKFAVNAFIRFQELIDGFDSTIFTGKFTGFVNDNVAKVAGFVLTVGDKLDDLPGLFQNSISTAVDVGSQKLSDGANWLTGIASGIPRRLYDAAYGVVSLMGSLLSDAMGAAGRAVLSGIDYLGNLAYSIPGRIAGGLGNAGGLLYAAGRSIIQSLIDGLESKIPSVSSVMSSVASKIKGFLPFSPAKEGPLSGFGNPYYSGISIGRLLSEGLLRQRDAVGTAAAGLASATQTALAPQMAMGSSYSVSEAGASTSGRSITITINAAPNVPTEQQIITALRNAEALYAV